MTVTSIVKVKFRLPGQIAWSEQEFNMTNQPVYVVVCQVIKIIAQSNELDAEFMVSVDGHDVVQYKPSALQQGKIMQIQHGS